MTSLLKINNVSMQFGGLRALGDVNFEIVEGEIFGLIGPNGAGKTTLFNCVTGVYAPTEGAVEFSGSSITGKRPDQIVDIGICRTFQQIRLFPNMTALENVIVGVDARHKSSWFGAIFRSPRRKREEIHAEDEALRLLDFCGVKRYANDLGRNLSYGDQRRLEIARALATKPKLVLLDEPAAGMNPVEKNGLRDLVRKIRDEGTTVLLIEHDMKVVMGLSDRVAVLDHGEVIAEGQPEEVQSNPKVIEAYLGTGGAAATTDGQTGHESSAPDEPGTVSARAQEPGGEK